MFPKSFFSGSFFAGVYFPPVDGVVAETVNQTFRGMIANVGRMMGA